MQNLVIRPGREADAAAIAAILRSVGWFEHLKTEAPEKTRERIRSQIRRRKADDSHSLYVAEVSARGVAGYAAVHWLRHFFFCGPEGYLSELFVGESSRGLGIGKKLLNAIVREAGRRDCARLMLLNGKNRESYRRRFYSKNGWSEREEIANFVFQL
jgi:GNAT superfamily N-acetyltransferase